MNDDIREVFATALPESEPPTVTHGPTLAGLGRKRQHRRRIGFAASGATFAVAAVAAAALVIPGAFGDDQYGATGIQAETNPEVLSELVRETMAEAFPDVEFTMLKDGYGDEPFDLKVKRHFDLYYLQGAAGVERDDGEPPQEVTISLLPPGDWSAEPQQTFSHDSKTLFLTECAEEMDEGGRGGGPVGHETSTDCGSKDLGDDGLRYTSETTVTGTKDESTGIDDEGLTGSQHITALHRPDDTAVKLFNGCGLNTTDEKTCEPDDLIAADLDAVTKFLVNAPKVAAEYPR